jgi:DNA-binding response OmpR family regulator
MRASEGLAPLILVVEDDHGLRELLVALLAGEGYRVVTAADGLDALEVVGRGPPDLILVDAGMPRLDGAGFCRAYRAAGGAAPVIVVSAASPRRIAATAVACGAAAFVAKPFNIADVLATVARHLAP